MKTGNFYKLVSQALKTIDLKIIAKNMEDSYEPDSDSKLDSYTNFKQEICRYELLDITARKDSAV